MVRLIVSGFVLVLFVILLGRCQMGNVGVGMGLTLYDTVSVITSLQSQIERFHYDHQSLPKENRELGAPPPQQFVRKSPLLRDVEVLHGGVIYVRFQAENKGMPVELVYRPAVASRYRLQWQCESYNLTKEWRSVLPQVCADAAAAFDREQYVSADTSDYIARVTREQREAKVINVAEINRPDCLAALASPSFVAVDATTVALWALANEPERQYAVPRPADLNRTAHLGLGSRLLGYAGDRLQTADPAADSFAASTVYLVNTSRWRWMDEMLWVNSGPALATLDLCGSELRINTQYLMDLGAFNRITDFLVHEGRAILSTEQSVVGAPASAVQIVHLQSNRTAGFLKLEGKARGLALNGRYLYVANGSYGISVLDVFDATLPRLLHRISTRDAAQDVLLLDDHLLVADRLGGLALYRINADRLDLVQRLAADLTAEQLLGLGNGYISVTAREGTTTLWRWQNGNLAQVSLP